VVSPYTNYNITILAREYCAYASEGVVLPRARGRVSSQSINQSKSSKSHTSTREATSQHHHTGGKPCVAKQRRLGGLRAKRASVSLRDSLNICTLFKEACETVNAPSPSLCALARIEGGGATKELYQVHRVNPIIAPRVRVSPKFYKPRH